MMRTLLLTTALLASGMAFAQSTATSVGELSEAERVAIPGRLIGADGIAACAAVYREAGGVYSTKETVMYNHLRKVVWDTETYHHDTAEHIIRAAQQLLKMLVWVPPGTPDLDWLAKNCEGSFLRVVEWNLKYPLIASAPARRHDHNGIDPN